MRDTLLHDRGRQRPDRALHLVDLENLIGAPDFSRAQSSTAYAQYQRAVGVGPRDLVVVAVSHRSLLRTAPWSGARRLVRSGVNGADLELISVAASEDLAARFRSVIVASGDGIFAGVCARLQEHGCHVTVVSRPEALSRRLAFAVRDRVLFTPEAARLQVDVVRAAA